MDYKNMIPIKRAGSTHPEFLIKVDKRGDYDVDMSVFEVQGWLIDDDCPSGLELYVECTVNWDGCSHVVFGDVGYIHLCGLDAWEKHSAVMMQIYSYARVLIPKYDADAAE